MRERVNTEAGRITSDSQMRFSLKRDQVGITIKVESSFVETPDGKPISMKSTMQLGALPTTTEYTFGPTAVSVRSIVGKNGPAQDKGEQPLPEGDWRTPRAAERYMAERIAAGDTKVSVRTVDPVTGVKPITATHELIERTNLDVIGKTVPAFKWKSTTDLYPDLVSTDFTDDRGAALRTEVKLGEIALVIVRADKDLALAELDPPELLVSTLIKPDKPIDNPRALRRAVYAVRSSNENLPDIPTTGSQRFERLSPNTGRITVDLDPAATPAAPDHEVADEGFRACSPMVTCDDAEVTALVPRALSEAGLKPDAPASARAEALRSFVYRYIEKKSLGVGFASAAEVAQTRTGDCSEHGVLLCALLRAEKIPARVISGVVYVDGFAGERAVFGYHMWAQALLEDGGKTRWVDLDAALSERVATDATHIVLAPSSLNEDTTTNALVKLVPLIGTLRIDVEEVK